MPQPRRTRSSRAFSSPLSLAAVGSWRADAFLPNGEPDGLAWCEISNMAHDTLASPADAVDVANNTVIGGVHVVSRR
jgi:hypothetical protein